MSMFDFNERHCAQVDNTIDNDSSICDTAHYMTPAYISALFTPTQVAEKLQINKNTVYRLIRNRKLPAIRIGRTYRVEPTELDGFLQARSTRVQVRDARFSAVWSIAEDKESVSPSRVQRDLEELDATRPSSIT